MTEATLNSPISQRVCTLSGLEQKRLAGKLIELEDLEKTLEMAIREVAQATKDEYFWRAMEVSAKLIQVSSDLAIAILEEGASKAGMGAGAKAVSVTYDVAKMVVDALNGDINAKKALIFSTNAKVDGIAEILSSKGSNYGKAVNNAKVLANLANDLYEYWDSRSSALNEKSSLIGASRTAYGQLMRIKRQIKETREALANCPL
jgi:hypothetical protein